ncbi:hypothetical protein F7P69_26260 [Cellulosimicrobium funkei]|nr:hypothetical protein [Cellulosimicrobium funkei]
MDFDTSFWWGALAGGVVGLVLERLLGRPLDILVHHSKRILRRHRSEQFLKKAKTDAAVFSVGDDYVYVHAFNPNGLTIRTQILSPQDWTNRWEELPDDLRPAETQHLLHELATARQELESDHSKWNEERFGLSRIRHGRDGSLDRPIFELKFHPTDFAASTVLRRWYMERRRSGQLLNLSHEDFSTVLPGMSHSFGVNATVLTSDDQLILVRRSARSSSGRASRHVSVNEGMNATDLDADGNPDVVRALARGLQEELGIRGTQREQVTFHSLVLDATRYQWALLGHVDLRDSDITAAEVDVLRKTGQSPDAWENQQLYTIPCTPKAVLEELSSQHDWIAHGWTNLLLSSYIMFPERQRDFTREFHKAKLRSR